MVRLELFQFFRVHHLWQLRELVNNNFVMALSGKRVHLLNHIISRAETAPAAEKLAKVQLLS